MVIFNMVGGGGGATVDKFEVKFSVKTGTYSKSITTATTSGTTVFFSDTFPSTSTFRVIVDSEDQYVLMTGEISENIVTKGTLRSSTITSAPSGLDDAVTALTQNLTSLIEKVQPTSDRPLFAYLRPILIANGYYQGQYYQRTLDTTSLVQVKLYYEDGTLKTAYSAPGNILKTQLYGDSLVTTSAVTVAFTGSYWWYLADLQYPA